MHRRLLDILSNREVPIDQEQLADYLKGNLDESGQHELEKNLQQGNEMEEDAWDGWQEMKKPDLLLHHADEINRNLQNQLNSSKKSKRKKAIHNLPWAYWLLGFILILVIIAWMIIWIMKN